MRITFDFFLLGVSAVQAQDLFNYRETNGRDYGPRDWDEVSCSNLETCLGWPDKHIGSVGFKLTDWPNNCEWCPIEGNNCGQHRQSPIDLQRDRADPNSSNWKECEDWHWMQFKDGTCNWDHVKDQFTIGRHGLQHKLPVKSNGDIDCSAPDGARRFPKLDYSKGYQDWWYLSQTEISVPSEHVQHGKRYAAEVVLSHFYEKNHPWNHVGKVAIFLQDYENEAPWHFLDKLICQWRRVEEEARSKCNLPPAPVYKMCELYRGQQRGEQDFEAPTEQVTYPTFTPLVPPKDRPILNYGGEPPLEKKPLQLCEGDCDFPTDCAPGLICHRRDAFEGVPGCLGGEEDPTNTDYCVFDMYGDGYDFPTDPPSMSPTVTARPSVSLLDPKPLKFYGGTPPADRLPLNICEGDCDNDDQCADGLVCFQRNENVIVPGCIGGDVDSTKTDYCILDPYGDRSYTFPPTVEPSIAAPQASTDAPTSFERPTGGALKLINNIGWEPPTPIAECAGDCDEDSDCGLHMFCFQRNTQFKAVPGCWGGEKDPTLTDYCTYGELPPGTPIDRPPTPAPTGTPTSTDAPTEKPTAKPTFGPFKTGTVKFLGWSPELPIGMCEGDCDKDTDCDIGLMCYQRGQYEDVPGCEGGSENDSLTDFCFDPRVYGTESPTAPTTPEPTITPNPTDSPTLAPTAFTTLRPTLNPTASPSESSANPTISGRPSVSPMDPKPLKFYGGTPPADKLPLHICEGDCDNDDQCADGLICFQRNENMTVPGCIGGEEDHTRTDFCILDPYGDGSYTFHPTSVPTVPAIPDSTETPVVPNVTNHPTVSPTNFLSKSPTGTPTGKPTKSPTSSPTNTPTGSPTAPLTQRPTDPFPKLVFRGWSPPYSLKPLKRCEGDCDINTDCGEGLVCYQRYRPNEKVPGCDGGEDDDSLADYCVPEGLTLEPTASPTKGPTGSPSLSPTINPTDSPTPNPTDSPTPNPTDSPTPNPTDEANKTPSPTIIATTGEPEKIDCNDDKYDDINFGRMCNPNSCCSNPRKSGGFCERMYTALGEEVESACHHCCQEEDAGKVMEVGPPNEVNPEIPQTVECVDVDEAYKICRDCCDVKDGGNFCKSQYSIFSNDMESICWYCCYPSQKFDERRELESSRPNTGNLELDSIEIPEHAKVTYDDLGRTVILREENFEFKGTKEDDEAYFNKIYEAHKRRLEEPTIIENYDDVMWWPYEWLLKVGSEYYFRYEGTQTTPPCINKAHWRIMKDPIRVAPHQIKELERLVAWRINDQCQADTAGKPQEGNPDAVDVARPLQSYDSIHRMVFCECQDWPSKFPQERSWCRNWKNRDPAIRFDKNPYNWQQSGF